MRINHYFAQLRNRWIDGIASGLHSVAGETESSDEQNRRNSVRDKRQVIEQDPDQEISGYRRKATKNKCPCEPFNETLKILNELL